MQAKVLVFKIKNDHNDVKVVGNWKGRESWQVCKGVRFDAFTDLERVAVVIINEKVKNVKYKYLIHHESSNQVQWLAEKTHRQKQYLSESCSW